MKNKKVSISLAITIALMVVGNLIGAGILALPIETGLAGLLPSLLGMLVIGGAMYFSAYVFALEATRERSESFNFWQPTCRRNKTMLAGMAIGYIMNAVWIQVGIGNLP